MDYFLDYFLDYFVAGGKGYMYKIVTKRALNPTVTLMEVEAPHIARKAKAGQFIIFRVDEQGERVPLTIADYDRERGTVTIIFQMVGASTRLLNARDWAAMPDAAATAAVPPSSAAMRSSKTEVVGLLRRV